MALYPLNIFTPEPLSGGIRPFIIFVIKDVKWNVKKELSAESLAPVLKPVGGFALPMTTTGLIDKVSHAYSEEPGLMGLAANAISELGGSIIKDGFRRAGIIPDPKLTQIYQGTSSRSWSGTWQIIPQSLGESAAVGLILWEIKRFGSPKRFPDENKIGALIQPSVYSIYFSNPVLENAMQFDKMALEEYTINYFAQGYASTYKDMMPKQIELTLSFKEFGIKTQQDWDLF